MLTEVLMRCCKNHDGQPHDYVWSGPPAPRACPKCGNEHRLQPLVRVYLLVKDKNGPIKGANGNYYVASDHSKKAIVEHLEAWSDSYMAVNNPACMETAEYKKLKNDHEMSQFLLSGGLVVPDSFNEPAEAK